jgi:hypothetical protein
MKADCAAEALEEHREAMASWTDVASFPQTALRLEGSSWVLTALRRQAGGMART